MTVSTTGIVPITATGTRRSSQKSPTNGQRRSKHREVGDRSERGRRPARRRAALEHGRRQKEGRRARQRLAPDVANGRDAREVLLVDDVGEAGRRRRDQDVGAADQERPRRSRRERSRERGPLRRPRRPRGRGARRAIARPVNGSSGEQVVSEDADEDRERGEEQRREAGLDLLLGQEDARIGHADLEEAAPDDPAPLGRASGRAPRARRRRESGGGRRGPSARRRSAGAAGRAGRS